jgi:hypothetical protein
VRHAAALEVVARTHRVVEDDADLALPTEAFATQKTAAVLTTRRPEHSAARIAATMQALLSPDGGASLTSTGGAPAAAAEPGGDNEEVDDFHTTLSTHVVILGASLRQCVADVYAELRDALAQRRQQQKHAGGRGGGDGGDSDGVGDSEREQVFLDALEARWQVELHSLRLDLDSIPAPSSASFVQRAPEALSQLQALRRALLTHLAGWQYAFQSMHMHNGPRC